MQPSLAAAAGFDGLRSFGHLGFGFGALVPVPHGVEQLHSSKAFTPERITPPCSQIPNPKPQTYYKHRVRVGGLRIRGPVWELSVEGFLGSREVFVPPSLPMAVVLLVLAQLCPGKTGSFRLDFEI